MNDKNPFGGGNANSLYFPMSEDEQETLDRIFEEGGLKVLIEAKSPNTNEPLCGYIDNPRITYGDARVQIPIDITFSSPVVFIPVYTMEMTLIRDCGRVLFSKEYSVLYAGQPEMIGQGTQLAMVWDFAIREINPELVKAVKPGALGLTTRVGNTQFNTEKQNLLNRLRTQEQDARKDTADRLQKALSQAASRE